MQRGSVSGRGLTASFTNANAKRPAKCSLSKSSRTRCLATTLSYAYGCAFMFSISSHTPAETTSSFRPHSGKKVAGQQDKQKDVPMDAIRELKTMKDLDHPQVLRLRDIFCTSEGRLTLVLDYMPYDLEKFLA